MHTIDVKFGSVVEKFNNPLDYELRLNYTYYRKKNVLSINSKIQKALIAPEAYIFVAQCVFNLACVGRAIYVIEVKRG